MSGCSSFFRGLGLSLLALAASALPAPAQQGLVLSGAGPINRSMGGASVAAPLDAAGALYWNPATAAALPSSEMEFGVELLQPHLRLSSSVPAGALGPGLPPVALSGSDSSDSGISVLPTVGLVYQAPESELSYGLGVFSAGGFSVNYPASLTNPILTPQPPNGVGLGALQAELQVLQVVPAVACRLTDRLAVGLAPVLDLARLTADPAVLVSPDDANGDGFATYPAATHTHYSWGAGFEAGLFYAAGAGWNFGASVKSPQWLQSFRYHATDELGRPRDFQLHFDFPLIVSAGASYTGFERWVLAADARYLDYHDTRGFEQSGFDATGALRGLGWESIFALALGAQYQLTDPLFLRAGYTYNMNPIDDANTSFNVASSTIAEHTLYLGLSYHVTPAFLVSVAYAHAFENSIGGPIVSPLGPVPGSSVRTDLSADTAVVGATVKF